MIDPPPEFSPFVPRRGLRGGHAQTLASYFMRRRDRLPVAERRFFRVAQDTEVVCDCHWQADKTGAMTAVLVHGLEGSSESSYMLGTAAKSLAAGMNVVRMNMRNCGGTEKLTPTLYHSGFSGDLAAVVKELIQKDGLSRIGLAGFSMGGNLVMNLVGEWGAAKPHEVRASATVSPVMDLGPSADALHNRSNRVYEIKFVRGLARLFRRKAELFPERYDASRLKGVRSIREFDEQITAPYDGFRDADDYYARVSSSRLVERITLPSLVIYSTDDPFIRLVPGTRAKLRGNAAVKYLETHRGGHCAFLAAPNGYDGRWAERKVVEFLSKF
ncbi:MAG TPA: alpha/beta fold hydrolase [Terriglobia bacterium]|nr:alpha/beta fold hydrolase [Terriglobia bacterium]